MLLPPSNPAVAVINIQEILRDEEIKFVVAEFYFLEMSSRAKPFFRRREGSRERLPKFVAAAHNIPRSAGEHAVLRDDIVEAQVVIESICA